MQTKDEVGAAFKADLQALLNKWDADILARGHVVGEPEWGSHIRMRATIPAIYDEHRNCIREHTEIDLGWYVEATEDPPRIPGTDEAWDERVLGADENHAVRDDTDHFEITLDSEGGAQLMRNGKHVCHLPAETYDFGNGIKLVRVSLDSSALYDCMETAALKKEQP